MEVALWLKRKLRKDKLYNNFEEAKETLYWPEENVDSNAANKWLELLISICR
jgi:hypothetical protein